MADRPFFPRWWRELPFTSEYFIDLTDEIISDTFADGLSPGNSTFANSSYLVNATSGNWFTPESTRDTRRLGVDLRL